MAGSGANINVGVTGVAQFKQNLNQAKQAVKTFDAQLALTEKQMKASGDAEELMGKKAEELKSKLEAQKQVVESAEKALEAMRQKGVDRASKAYQDMYRTLLQAQGQLIDTEQELQGVSENSEDAANNVSGMNQQLKNIGKQVSFETVVNGIGKITGAMEKGAKWAWKLGEALVRNVLGAGSYADELAETADKSGIDVETLQRMRKTALLIDTDADTIISARDKLEKSMGKTSSQETMGAFAALGIDPSDHNVEDTFWAAGEALLNMTDSVEQETYAQQIFGKSWKELLPLFKAGREEYDRTMASWNVLSQEQIDNLGKMDDSYQTMTAEWETFQNQVLEALSGPMKEILDTLTGLMKQFNEYLATPEGKEMLQAMGDAVSGLVQNLVNIDPEKVVEGLAGVFQTITNAFQWIYDHQQDVVNAMKFIIGGWAALKLTGGALQVLQLINGLKGMTLGGGGGSAAGAAAAAGGATVFSGLKKVAGAAAKAVPWLAGIGVLTKNAFTPQGNDDLWDENGNPTALAKSLGITGTMGEYNSQKGKMPNPKAAESTAKWIDLRWETLAKLFAHADENADAATRLASGANWAPSYMGGMRVPTQVSQLPSSLNQAPSWMGGGYGVGTGMRSGDLNQFLALPAEMQTAVMTGVMRGMSNVTIVIDGPQMTSTIGAGMANMMLMAVK